MTAEIAILNKEGIALASDSAVTMTLPTGAKIKQSANKLFALSKFHPVGIMIFGNAAFMGIPWEIIIKIYRKTLKKRKFDELGQYANHFLKYINNRNLIPESVQEKFVKDTIDSYFRFFQILIRTELMKVISPEKENISVPNIKDEMKKITPKVIDEHYKMWKNAKHSAVINKNCSITIKKKYKKFITELINKHFVENLNLDSKNKLHEIAGFLFCKFPDNIQNPDIAGIVISGYGDKDLFPCVKTFIIEGVVENQLKYYVDEHKTFKITFDREARVIPFAQEDMVETFMYGMHPLNRIFHFDFINGMLEKYPDEIIKNLDKYNDKEKEKLLKKLVKSNKRIFDNYTNQFGKFAVKNHSRDIHRVVSMLPKDELASMAESLVNLTSFKRKVSMEMETVGGPVDVAVISKGDGFVWIKRKHYFNKDLNPQFFKNYNMEVE